MIDKIKMWLRTHFPSVFLDASGQPRFTAIKTSDEVPQDASPMTKVVMIAGVVLPLGILLVVVFFILRFLYKSFVKRPVRRKKTRRTSVVRRAISSVRRRISGAGKGSIAMRRKMAKVRAARRKKRTTRKK